MRPEGWDNPLTKACLLAEHNDFNIVGEAFEAGADAYEEAALKGISDGEGGYWRLTLYLKPVRAKLVEDKE